MTDVIRKAAERGDWKAALALLEKHPMTRDDFGQGPARTNINTIKIGHLIQRDPAHKIPRIIDQDGPAEESEVEPEPAVEPEKDESQKPDVQSEQIEQQETVEAEPEQEVISTDTQEFQGRSAFDIQFRKERGIK